MKGGITWLMKLLSLKQKIDQCMCQDLTTSCKKDFLKVHPPAGLLMKEYTIAMYIDSTQEKVTNVADINSAKNMIES